MTAGSWKSTLTLSVEFQLKKPDYEELFADLSGLEREILRKSLLKIGVRLERLISKEDEEFY